MSSKFSAKDEIPASNLEIKERDNVGGTGAPGSALMTQSSSLSVPFPTLGKERLASAPSASLTTRASLQLYI